MRHGFAALLMLMSSVSAASAQGVSIEIPSGFLPPGASAARLSVDDVLARMMTFDRDRDGRVATSELSERMQGLVARGDRSRDGALDESEIRMLATAQQFAVRSLQSSGYGFADSVGLSSRNHIENSIDDLRLAPSARQEAKRIAMAFVDEFEAAAVTNLRQALAPVITEQQLAQLEASLTRFHGVTTVVMQTVPNETRSSAPVASASSLDVSRLLVRQQLPSEQMRAVAAAADAFRSERQLDDARRSELVARLCDVLTSEESENLRAALTRRPLAKGPGSSLARVLPTVRDVQFTAPPAVR